MSAITNVTIGGYVFKAHYEYTSPLVTEAWKSALVPFNTIYNYKASGSNPPATQITAANASDVVNSLSYLLLLANSGVTDPSTGVTSYLNYTMASNLDQIIKSLNSSGIYVSQANNQFVINVVDFSATTRSPEVAPNIYVITPGFPPLSTNPPQGSQAAFDTLVANLQRWKDISTQSDVVQNALLSAQTQGDTGHLTFQSLVELEYVKTGNEILTKNLESLQQQLTATDQVLKVLVGLQNMHNNLVIQGKSAFSNIFNFTTYQPLGSGKGLTTFQTLFEGFFSYSSRVTNFNTVISGNTTPASRTTNVTLPHFSSYLPESYISRFIVGNSAPPKTQQADGLGSARILAYNHFEQVEVASNTFQLQQVRFVTVSRVFNQLPPTLRDIYANNQNALVMQRLSIKSIQLMDQDNNGDENTWQKLYTKAASAYFGSPVIPQLPSSLIYNVSAFMKAKNQLVNLRDQILEQIHAISKLTPASAQGDPTTLLNQLRGVYSDLNTIFVDHQGNPITSGTGYLQAFDGFQAWMLDKYNLFNTPDGVNSGKIQTRITQTITAAQATNDEQKELVRRAIFIFEEYYKSASSILQTITQIIQKMAQNIAR